MRDLDLHVTTFVSRRTGVAGAGAGGLFCGRPAISGDGRLVAFWSVADNLSDEDVDGTGDVYVRDLQTHTTTLVSRASGVSGDSDDSGAFEPSISADGRVVAFESLATNLDPADGNDRTDVYVRNLVTSTTSLASRATGGAAADSASEHPSLSADGRLVAFASEADDLSDADVHGTGDVYVRDLQTHTTTLASRTAGHDGPAGSSHASEPAISADGGAVAFVSGAVNLGADGQNDAILVRDLQAHTTSLASRASGAGGASADADSEQPSLSADGRLVAFASEGGNLSDADIDGIDVFLRGLDGALPGTAPDPQPPGPQPPGPQPPSGPAGDSVAPVLSAVSLTRARFAVARGATRVSAVRRGTAVRFRLSEPATVRIAFARALPGSRVGGRCRRPSRRLAKRPRCTRLVGVGALTRHARPAGRNRVAFSGRIGRRALTHGRYRATLTATDAAGNRSTPRRTAFTIVR